MSFLLWFIFANYLYASELACVGNAEAFWLTRDDGVRLGNAITQVQCDGAREASRYGLVCTRGAGNEWRPTVIETTYAYGRFPTSFNDCLELTRNASQGLVCTNTGTYNFQGRKPTTVDSGPFRDAKLHGASGQQASCTKAVREARNGVVCVCNGDFCGQEQWIRKRLTDGAVLPPTTSLDECIELTALPLF